MIEVTVIIPTFQGRDSVKRALTALATQTFPHDEFEVIVSIDGSEDGTREMVKEFSCPYKLRSIWGPNSGRASASNRAFLEADGNILILIDDDMEPSPEFVEAHYSAHQYSPILGVMGAAPIFIDETSTLAARYIAAEFNSRQIKISDPGYTFQLWDFYAGNFSIRRDVLIEAGAFDESFKQYGFEDIELAKRLIKSGIKIVYNPHALCTQYYENDFRSLATKTVDSGKMAVLLVNMYPETFTELKFRDYNNIGWKWRTLRLFLIWSSILIPITTDAVVYFAKLFEKSDPRIHEKIYSLTMDYFFWLGVWSTIRKDNDKQLLGRIKSYKKLNKFQDDDKHVER
jgi:GT2 family glycosyltransferase